MFSQFERYFGLTASAMTIIGFFIALLVLPSDYKLLGYLITGIITGVSLLILAYSFGKRSVKSKIQIDIQHPTEKQFADILIGFFERKKTDNENEEIIRLGLALSTPLWLSQNYKIRRIIGEYLEEAARKTKNIPVKIKTLIDDLGWTNVELGDYLEAEKRINHGIQLSVENSNGYYLAKGYRHLFGLYYRLNKIEKAEEYLNKAITKTNELESHPRKIELIAEIHYAKSTLELAKNNFDESLKEINIAYDKYLNLPNKEWAIKLMARKGEILLGQGKIYDAREIFKEGLSNSKDYHFNKQIVVNLVGLGKCSFEEKDLVKAKRYFDDALTIAEDIGMYYEKSIINSQIEKFKK